MEIRTTEEIKGKITDYAKALLDCQLRKKEIDQEIKDLKEEFKEEGIAVGKVTAVLNKIKAQMKKSETDRVEEDMIADILESNEDISNTMAMIIA
jgi:uncharacterized protein (UPF0335 family)